MVETLTPALSPALAHIIERPRLIAHLEEGGGSRVSVFAAPAGYGKTTLARQWSERQTGQVAWYRTTRASGDVALLAVQFDELLASLAPELPREPGKVASIASVNPSPKPLGRALVRTFESITDDILLIVDEWEAAETPESDELLSMLVDGLPVRWVITTRERPEWFAPKLEVYGEGLEIGVDELTMTDDEAAQVLSSSGAIAGRARVMRTAAGWPAVLGLAAMSGEVDFTAESAISRKLYEFLARELLAGASAATQECLMLLAVAGIPDLTRAEQLLGAATKPMLSEAVARGLLAVPDGTSLWLHPLLKELLVQRFKDSDDATRADLLSKCRQLFEARLWDEALSVAEVSESPEFICEAVEIALDHLLAGGRTNSLERWIMAARAAEAKSGVVALAESEYLLRRAEFDAALGLAARAAGLLDGDLAGRAHLTAARAAHLSSRAVARDDHLAEARARASELGTRTDLLWMSFASATADERVESARLLAELAALTPRTSENSLRVATGKLQLAIARGGLPQALEHAEAEFTLLEHGGSPYAVTAFLNQYTNALAVVAEYQRAAEAADLEYRLASEYDLEFVKQYAQVNRARAMTGLRRFADANHALRDVDRRLQTAFDPYLQCQLAIYSAGLLLSGGDLSRASDVLRGPIGERAGDSILAEHQALHALVLAALGEDEEAEIRKKESRRLSSTGLEAAGLVAAADLVQTARSGEQSKFYAVGDGLFAMGTMDALVLAWRSNTTVAELLVADPQRRARVTGIFVAANDLDIAKKVGLRLPRAARPRGRLSSREREVHELIAQGLTNEEIARLLFISLSTTKVHVKHIFEKLGAHSRVEAARLWESDSQ